jgi:hypothetical protein
MAVTKYCADFVLDNEKGEIVEVGIRAEATVTRADLKGLRCLADISGSCMRMGMVLYDGAQTLFLDNGIYSVPLFSLWCE